MKHFGTLLFLIATLLLTGCGQGIPEGFPKKLLSCRIVVMDGDDPVKEATVSLLPEDEQQKFSMIGITDDRGMAKIRTTQAGYYGNGVPKGTYKVLIIGSEPPDLEHTLTLDERANLPPDDLVAYEYARQRRIGTRPLAVPKEFNKMDKTPLTWTVDRKGAELKVNVADYKSE
jgi:hypothetical protein